MEKSCIDKDFSIQNIKFTSTVPIHYIYGETSGVYKSNMDFYYLGKLNQDCFAWSFIETCYGLG